MILRHKKEDGDCVKNIGIGIIALALSGCINIKAPEKPIEINLNVNIKQEVIVKLQKDASDFISSNPELFPK